MILLTDDDISRSLIVNLTNQGINYALERDGNNVSISYNDTHEIKDYIHVIRCKYHLLVCTCTKRPI